MPKINFFHLYHLKKIMSTERSVTVVQDGYTVVITITVQNMDIILNQNCE